jgi:hypothetical protein
MRIYGLPFAYAARSVERSKLLRSGTKLFPVVCGV